jgi:TolA-binding protein
MPLLALLAAGPAFAQSADEHLAAASALYDAGRYAESAERLETFLRNFPSNEKAGVAALTLGRCYSELKQYAKAIPPYEKALGSRDAMVTNIAHLGLAEAAMQTSQWDKASRSLDVLIRTELKGDQAPIIWYWRGQANFNLNRFDMAEQSYLRVTQDYGKSEVADGAWFGAGVAALRQNKAEPARQRLKTLVDRFPSSPDRPQAMLIMAQLDLDAKRYKEARSGFEAILKDQGARAAGAEIQNPAEEGLVHALLELQDYAAAAPRLESFIARLPANDPQKGRAQLALGNCRYRQKQYQPALAAYQDAGRSSDPEIASEAQYWAANAALQLNKHVEAAAQFSVFADRFPKHANAPKAQLRAGDALAAGKQPEQAAAAYEKLLAKYPQSPEAGEAKKALADLADTVTDPVQLARILKSLPAADRAAATLRLARIHVTGKRYTEAETTLTGLIRENPDAKAAGEAKYLLGVALDAQKKSEPAAAAFQGAVQADPSAKWAVDAQGRLAWLYLDLKQPAQAEKAATAALGLKPAAEAERQARLALLQASLDQEKWQQAFDGCRALMASNPPADTVPTLLYTQAWVMEKMGKSAEALPLWEKLAAEHRRSEHAAEALIHVGDARFKAENHSAAREAYAAVVTGFPKSPLANEARFKLGSALYHADQVPEAMAEWEKVTTDPGAGAWGPEALYWSGVALDKLGKKKEAIVRLEKLVAQHPSHARVAAAKVRLAALKAVAGK